MLKVSNALSEADMVSLPGPWCWIDPLLCQKEASVSPPVLQRL